MEEQQDKYTEALNYRRIFGNIEKAQKCLLEAVKEGNPDAIFHLAYAYYSGDEWSLGKNPEKAAELFLASGSDSGYALYIHCLIYETGVKRNDALIKKYANLLEDTKDNFTRGFCLFNGYIGSYVNTSQAIKERLGEGIRYLEESANIDNNEFAQNLLGDFYANGIGIKKSLPFAACYFNNAAFQGSAYAKKRLQQIKKLGQD
jgi:TPR repeat protein